MNLLLHHLRKDLRFARWSSLLLVIYLLGLMYWYSLLPLEKRLSYFYALSPWRYFICVMCFLLIGGQTQRDAPFREGAFFRTRPMGLSAVIQSKALYALLIVVLSATLTSVSILMLGLKPGVLDFLLIFTEEILVLSALSAVSMALALRQESAGKYFSNVVLWGGILFIGWIAFTWCRSLYLRTEKPEWSYTLEHLKTSRLLMAQAVALIGAVIGIVLFVRSSRRETITRSLAITALCTLATLFFWPLNFVEPFVPSAREAPKSEWPDPEKLEFSYEEKWVGGDKRSFLYCADGGYDDVIYRRIDAYYSLAGLTGGWQAAYDGSYRSVLTLSNGKTFSKNRKARAGLGWQAILPQLGIPNRYANDGKQTRQFELTEFKLDDAEDALTGAKLAGTMQIHLKRPVVLASLPLKSGASTVIDGRLITITDVVNSGDEIRVNVVTQPHMVHLHGGWQKIWTNRFNYGVIHTERKEFLDHPGAGGSNLRCGHYSLQDEEISGMLMEDHKKKPIPPDWLDGAELLITSDEDGGCFSQSFDFPNINLSNEP